MKTIIHIGQHKTGTTSIQHFLKDHQDELARQRIHFPIMPGGQQNASHFSLNIYALDQNRYSPMKEDVVREYGYQYLETFKQKVESDVRAAYEEAANRQCDTVLWSNEGLYLLNTEAEHRRLFRLFSRHSSEVEVVCCFRDSESFRESYKNELIKQGIPLSDDPDSYRYVENDSWLFDYDRKKHLLSTVFNKCSYFPYDPEDNVSRFLDVVGIQIEHRRNYRLNVRKP
ncbi:MAG TPA: hypothetical protein VFC95_00710 [Guyparkeria sp.]|nr:hypothetical protein [Guyparkeria sp.]